MKFTVKRGVLVLLSESRIRTDFTDDADFRLDQAVSLLVGFGINWILVNRLNQDFQDC